MLEWVFSADADTKQIVRGFLITVVFYGVSFLLVWLCAWGFCRRDWWDESKNVYVKAYTGWAVTLIAYMVVNAFLLVLLIQWLKDNGQGIFWGSLPLVIPILISGIVGLDLTKSAKDKINQELSERR